MRKTKWHTHTHMQEAVQSLHAHAGVLRQVPPYDACRYARDNAEYYMRYMPLEVRRRRCRR